MADTNRPSLVPEGVSFTAIFALVAALAVMKTYRLVHEFRQAEPGGDDA
jgi:hypothetical protein